MESPKYLVNISFSPNRPLGQTLSFFNGVTQSLTLYSGEWFVATMPELKISATGSNYTTALSNLLAIATASTTINPGYPPYSTVNK